MDFAVGQVNFTHLKQQTYVFGDNGDVITDKTLGRERLKVANTPSLSNARGNATAVSAWNLRMNIFLIPIDITVIQQ